VKKLLFLLPFGLFGAQFSGVVLDSKSHTPLQNATICTQQHCTHSDSEGKFHIDGQNGDLLHIKALGYRPYHMKLQKTKVYALLRAIRVKALYLTFWGASPHSKTYNNALTLLEKTPLNAVVVDIKNEYGNVVYKMDLNTKVYKEVIKKRTIRDIDLFMNKLKAKDAYLIARIVVFKDELQASSHPEYAIKRKDGTIWRNHDNMGWVDPFNKKSWKYIVDVAEAAAKQGFDEINFDYIRFPAKKGLVLSKPSTQQNRTKTIAAFLEYAKKRLEPYGVFISVDTYGNILWSKDDNNIGQTVEVFAQHADYLCPMLYPSGFSYGSFHFKYPAAHPYEVYERSIRHIKEKIDVKKLRPWIQAFRDYRKKRLLYDKEMIQAQIKACDEAQTNGWMLWSPSSKYKLEDYSSISLEGLEK